VALWLSVGEQGEMTSLTSTSTKKKKEKFGFTLFMFVAAFLFLIPIFGVFLTSFRTDTDISLHGIWALSGNLTVDNYTNIWSSSSTRIYMRNSFLVAIPATIISVTLGSLAGYVLAKMRIKGTHAITLFFVSGLFIPPQILLIPLFQLFNAIHLYDTVWPMIIVHSGYGISLCTLVMKNFFRNVPDELLEAAIVDGSSEPGILIRIVLPLSRPALGALATLQFTFIWNDFLYPLILARSENAQTIMVGILNMAGQYSTAYGAQAALSIFASAPTILVFFIFQKQFIAGLTTGAVKG
jgi:ABC-type glycerol-3-phosphate transport system permease component